MLKLFRKCFWFKSKSKSDLNEYQNYSKEFVQSLDKIEEHLYLADFQWDITSQTLEAQDIKYVLSVIDYELVSEYELTQSETRQSTTYFQINAFDNNFVDLLSYFADINQFISNGQQSGHNVLLHCKGDTCRSTTIAIAFLMNKYKMSYKSALDSLKCKRNICANPNYEFQLVLYEEMEFKLNANHRKFRRYLFETLLLTKCLNNINRYFKRLETIEDKTEKLYLGPKYLCFYCGYYLFNEIHVIRNKLSESKSESNVLCNWVYIEPRKWMNELSAHFDYMTSHVVNCPHCQQELVRFNNKFSPFLCNCSLHKGLGNSLRFRIELNKLVSHKFSKISFN